jgi:hypothetical protein
VNTVEAKINDRLTDMLSRYGETCSLKTAGMVISRDARTIRRMLDDGRLRWACAGTQVDVRSLCEYIEAPSQRDYDARLRKRRERAGISCRFRV